jgi:hypothetical protein
MEIELFVHFAEIAGVFVGFGALISLRSTRPADLHDVVYLQGVLGLGVGVLILALAPIVVSLYGVRDDLLWRSCAALGLTIWVGVTTVFWRAGASRALDASPERMDRLFPVVGAPLHAVIMGSWILIIVGVWPNIDQALYVTALVAGLVFAGYTLLVLSLSQPKSRTGDGDVTTNG